MCFRCRHCQCTIYGTEKGNQKFPVYKADFLCYNTPRIPNICSLYFSGEMHYAYNFTFRSE